MVRYLYLMYDILQKILIAQKARGFNRKNLKYKEVLKIFGYGIGTLFIRAYEQGERTYYAILARGYDENSKISFEDEKITINDIIFLIVTIFIFFSS
ncbi:energy-coupling factor transporter transmembrane component T family protein, partial [Methanocaldococcus sp.]